MGTSISTVTKVSWKTGLVIKNTLSLIKLYIHTDYFLIGCKRKVKVVFSATKKTLRVLWLCDGFLDLGGPGSFGV